MFSLALNALALASNTLAAFHVLALVIGSYPRARLPCRSLKTCIYLGVHCLKQLDYMRYTLK